jgi:predicted DNA-binding WGR domain protein
MRSRSSTGNGDTGVATGQQISSATVSEHLEIAKTARARCQICKETIDKGALRLGVTSRNYEGDTTSWSHAVCAAMRKPTPFLRALAGYDDAPKLERDQLAAIANATKGRKLVSVVWRHATEPRCVLEFARETYMLFTLVGKKRLVVEGPLHEVVASVPDGDLDSVVEAATAAGKQVSAKAAAKPPAAKGTAVLTQRFEHRWGAMTYTQDITLDEAKLQVTLASGGKPTRKKLPTLELARKYFRYCLARQTWTKVSGDDVELIPGEDFKDVKDKTPDYRYFENPTTKQFWDIDRDMSELHVTEGAIGTAGTETVEEFPWDGEAKSAYKQRIADKIAAGYAEPKGAVEQRRAGRR